MVLESLLGAIKDATSVAPQAFQSQKVATPGITYMFYRASDNGAVAQWRLQTRVSAHTLSEALAIEDKLSKSLVTVGDETKWGCSISTNGGGALIDAESNTPQIITYFDIVLRS